eukprot:CAMPEP_0178679182 /NCGR_PEP_ID=MMETSP0699-20121125/51_1 /TAXON_ID=265572 /ORGANISM="Extubocellulus spinifer, Strain CCMP396" /LENGTH=344 /DNA_ID=CAMNT_0020323527 /DNA_START=82 /DNA_END=1117 /DNA_ORIENTATION=-
MNTATLQHCNTFWTYKYVMYLEPFARRESSLSAVSDVIPCHTIQPTTLTMSRDSDVKDYLERRASPETGYERVECCNSSRALYCPECCRLLIPTADRPPPFSLPFNLDIILDDRRGSSTGLHAKSLVESMNDTEQTTMPYMQFIDLDRGDGIPTTYDTSNTFVLFPDKGSVPLASVANNIVRLVVLDCKWTKSSSKDRPEVQKLQKVHLTSPPETSFFWRWHNAGSGMLSTIEAIYYASIEVAEHKSTYPKENREGLINILWLFREQRASIQTSSERNRTIPPFNEAGKEQQRALRRYEGTEKQARDKEIGRRLKAKARREREKKKETETLSTLTQKLGGAKII